MNIPWIDRIGDWNPQLLRELKGRFKPRNVIIAVVASLVGQFLLFVSFLNQYSNVIYVDSKYCRLYPNYEPYILQRKQLNDQINHLYSNPGKNHKFIEKIQQKVGKINDILNQKCPEDAVNMQLWWHEHAPQLFLLISIIAILALLVAGTFMLIDDLSKEERRGTLNFIRFSPRSSASILVGKILGVPSLIYLTVILAIPLHLVLGFLGQIPIGEIFSFYGVLIASCAFLYSAALLFSFLSSSVLLGFQSWLMSGAVLFLLWFTNFYKPISQTPTDWISLFNPSFILPYLVDRTGSEYLSFPFNYGAINQLQWFYLPLGATGAFVILGALLNYTLWTYWIWQGLNRCFRNPNARIISKGQSYWLVFCFEVFTLGFALQEPKVYDWKSQTTANFGGLFLFNLVLLFSLIAILSPHRQDLQDWARYRRQQVSGKRLWNKSLWHDLILGEKSPAIVAIAINLLIFTSLFLPWMLLALAEDIPKEEVLKVILCIAFFFSMMMIYASIAQLMLMMRNNKRSLYATATIIAAISLPPIILSALRINPLDNPIPWLLSTFPWMGIQAASVTTIFLAFLGELSVLALINLRLTRQLQQAGESSTKALLTGHN